MLLIRLCVEPCRKGREESWESSLVKAYFKKKKKRETILMTWIKHIESIFCHLKHFIVLTGSNKCFILEKSYVKS